MRQSPAERPLRELLAGWLGEAGRIAVARGPDAGLGAAVEAAMAAAGRTAMDARVAPDGAADAVVVAGLTREAKEATIAQAVRVVRPSGRVLATAAGLLHGGLRARELVTAVGHFGIAEETTLSPGVASILRGDAPSLDVEGDREPGLVDAGPVVALVGRRAVGQAQRSETFFATLPRKVVAAAVCCRDDRGRLLCVEDLFKGHWTIPGGVVDAEESPDVAAAREALEEAGVAVEVGTLLGVFSARWPDRVTFLFSAHPVAHRATPGAEDVHPHPDHAAPRTRHPHEIGAVAWVPWDEALRRVAPYISEQLRLSTADPGRIWQQ